MQWRNDKNGYGLVAITFHWLLAVALLGLFWLGTWMVDLSYYHNWYHEAPSLHKSIGVIVVGLMLLRLLWRWSNPKPAVLGTSPMQNFLAESAHLTFYLLVILLGLSGYFISSAEGEAISVFGLFSIPALPWQFEQQADIAGEVHEIIAWTLIALVVVHLAAALKHHFINQDKTLKRMLTTSKGDIL
ncbi:cytochrome b [Thiomicrorhabdus sp. 6S3-12]|uniref:cytochrome b n=1 Tax=Thiomicrorhabdus sp. 6S3-12 TaxID=2819681 RepID=UPI001AADDD9B|nr:cytochrome b [Thiomicrorhabdus sp. 6S3-12]MBO1924836.1 cytochrome b [Thiomicrorhabdus sp. 6S3-12]